LGYQLGWAINWIWAAAEVYFSPSTLNYRPKFSPSNSTPTPHRSTQAKLPATAASRDAVPTSGKRRRRLSHKHNAANLSAATAATPTTTATGDASTTPQAGTSSARRSSDSNSGGGDKASAPSGKSGSSSGDLLGRPSTPLLPNSDANSLRTSNTGRSSFNSNTSAAVCGEEQPQGVLKMFASFCTQTDDEQPQPQPQPQPPPKQFASVAIKTDEPLPPPPKRYPSFGSQTANKAGTDDIPATAELPSPPAARRAASSTVVTTASDDDNVDYLAIPVAAFYSDSDCDDDDDIDSSPRPIRRASVRGPNTDQSAAARPPAPRKLPLPPMPSLFNACLNELEGADEQISHLMQSNEELRQSNEELQQQNRELTQQNPELTLSNGSLECKVDHLEDSVTMLEFEVAELEASNGSLTDPVQRLTEQLERAQQQVARDGEQLVRAQAVVGDLKGHLENVQTSQARLAREKEVLQRDIGLLNEAYAALLVAKLGPD